MQSLSITLSRVSLIDVAGTQGESRVKERDQMSDLKPQLPSKSFDMPKSQAEVESSRWQRGRRGEHFKAQLKPHILKHSLDT